MTPYILILILGFTGVATAEFNDQQACISAGNAAREIGSSISWICRPKGSRPEDLK
jgi:hypothetical protein